jgi:transmembrane sensor
VFTKVLGTSFNVKCYRGDKAAEVSVVSGKVLVYKAASGKKALADEVYLLPKQKVVAPVSDEHFVKKQETGSSMEIWQKNDLSFSNTPVSEVVVALNERFKTSIEIKDKQINEYQLTADFTDVNLPSVLELLSKSLGITYEIDNDKIRMSKLTN